MVWSFSQSKVEPVSTHLKALFFSPKVGVCDDTWILLLAVPGNVHGVCRSMCARCSDHLTSGWSSRGAQRYKKKLQGFHGFLEDQCLLSKITQIPVETPTFSFFFLHVFCVFFYGSSPVVKPPRGFSRCRRSPRHHHLELGEEVAGPAGHGAGAWRDPAGRGDREIAGLQEPRRQSCHGSLVGWKPIDFHGFSHGINHLKPYRFSDIVIKPSTLEGLNMA